ncbi:MAG: ABC transporter permease [Acidobacteriota bacterium]
MAAPRWLRAAVLSFPRSFRRRHGDDLLETLDDLMEGTAAADRGRVARRTFRQLVRSGIAERLSPFSPRQRSVDSPRSSAMEDFRHDLIHAWRSVVRRPGFAAIVVLTLAIGLGASAAMFSVIHGVLLEPLPYAESDQLVTLFRTSTTDPGRESSSYSLPDLRDVQREVPGLVSSAGYRRSQQTLTLDGEPRLVLTGLLTDGLLSTFGLAPHVGRDLDAADARPGAPKVAVVGYEFWRQHLGGAPDALGQTLTLSDESYEIIGVAPRDFDFPGRVEIYTALDIDIENDCGRDCHILGTVGRLAADVSGAALDAELLATSEALAAQFPDTNSHKRFAARGVKEQLVAPVRDALWTLLGAVQLVLLIAAANVANLLLVRGARRRRELAIRTAIGAGRSRLFRQLMLENSLLAAGGALLGWGVGWATLRGFLTLAPADLPRRADIALNGSTMTFTGVTTLVVLMLFGVAPAWRAAAKGLSVRSQAGERGGGRARRWLLSAEVALALVLLLGSGLLLRSFSLLVNVELGYRTDHLTRLSYRLPEATHADAASVVVFSEQLEARARSTPGVEAAGLAFAGPFGTSKISSHFFPMDRPDPQPGEELGATFDIVSPGFFETLELTPVRGRFFTERDTRQAPLALVISETLADRYFPGQDPVGQRARVGVGFGFGDPDDAAFTIVGVAPDIRSYSLTDQPAPAIYMAQYQSGVRSMSLLTRSQAGVDVVPGIKEHLRDLAPALPLRGVSTQDAAVAAELRPHRFYLSLLGAFAGVALALSALGLYAVVTYLVSLRTRELAVRMALGADAGSVLRLVLVDALKPAVVGAALGLIGAAFGVRVLESLLYGIEPYDALTFAAAPLALLTVAALATLGPAVRAARLEPRIALEED